MTFSAVIQYSQLLTTSIWIVVKIVVNHAETKEKPSETLCFQGLFQVWVRRFELPAS